jgi:SAM-dependent methyltransferase
MTRTSLYDDIGRGYGRTRRPDPRIAAAIGTALADAETVLNVGAGTGAYEPADRHVTAVEPSAVMLGQRPVGAAPAIQAPAEDLPFADDSFDAAIAIISDHHWDDRDRGLRELQRVARQRVLLVNVDPAQTLTYWLTREYLPGVTGLVPPAMREPGAWRADLERKLGHVTITPIPAPHDCTDGFYQAFWRRPEAYLDPVVREGISVFARLDPDEVDRGLAILRDDLASGTWRTRHADLQRLDALDVGLAIVTATVTP